MIRTTLSLVLAVLTLSACETLQSMDTKTLMQPLAGEWTVRSIGGTDVASMMPEGMTPPSLTIKDDGTVAGFTGVNNLTTSIDPVDLTAGKLAFKPAAVTRKAGPEAAMNVESQFLQMLADTTGFEVAGPDVYFNRGENRLLHLQRN